MPSDDPPFEFDEIIGDVTQEDGEYACPICGEYESDSVRSIKGHISGSKDPVHEDLGWNYEDEIKATAKNH
jgi:hypothetical protein